MSILGTTDRPLRVAIIGSGPSGFYAAEALMKSGTTVKIDMFERLPTPYGLVRGGVAPDHPKIRSVTKVYEHIAADERFDFFGNVDIGYDFQVPEMRRFYDALLFTCGSETDKRMLITGEDLPGSHGATQFVGWYNGHPDYRHLDFDLTGEAAVVIGIGNVAMDVSRILLKTVDELRHTEIAQHALDVLAESRIKEVHLIGRRGPAQAKFTTKELKEIGELPHIDPIVKAEELVIAPEDEADMQDPTMKNNLKYLHEFAARTPSHKRRIHFHFCHSPMRLMGRNRVQQMVLERNSLAGPSGRRTTYGTGETWSLPCQLVFRSIGYRGVPIPGVPFHSGWGIFPNDLGRITEHGSVVPGFYCAGWIKRGPSGVIGTNKRDSVETVGCLLEDIGKLEPCPTPSTEAMLAFVRSRVSRVVTFADWKLIDEAERARGAAVSKPRERFVNPFEMLSLLDARESAHAENEGEETPAHGTCN